MNPTVNQARKKRAFTIIELLTVMSIIVILIGLMVPALNKVRRYARDVQQMAQFNAISAAIELFNNEFDGYPPSGALDPTGVSYCGAMKLTEALVGQDLLGVHSNTVFRRDGLDAAGTPEPLYPPNIDNLPAVRRDNNLKARKGPYIQPENANAWRMEDIYGTNIGPFLANTFVLCDVYDRQMRSGERTGMPILYFRAETANSFHNSDLQMTRTDSLGNIYNYWDNHELVQLGKPWLPQGGTGAAHRLVEKERFYRNTQSDQITTTQRPNRSDTYILISAGWDGEYGTADDIYNFKWRYRD
jgi:prepilin-type N-terminal cleavage/methylation domain-containing protein